uniref:Uncharacterized protein n=1 Tax=Oryza punctata TaxID=4537 RepID=A0A0E0LFB6_ORYPU
MNLTRFCALIQSYWMSRYSTQQMVVRLFSSTLYDSYNLHHQQGTRWMHRSRAAVLLSSSLCLRRTLCITSSTLKLPRHVPSTGPLIGYSDVVLTGKILSEKLLSLYYGVPMLQSSLLKAYNNNRTMDLLFLD